MLEAIVTVSKNIGVSVDKLRLLDVGCGTGNYIASIRNHVESCDGIEFNEEMLKRCKEKL